MIIYKHLKAWQNSLVKEMQEVFKNTFEFFFQHAVK